MTNGNGNGNGGGKLTRLALLKQLAYHERAIESIRFVLQQFDDDRTTLTLDKALELDQERRALRGDSNGHAASPSHINKIKAHGAYWTKDGIRKRRAKTKKFIDGFSKTEPRPNPKGNKGIGVLIKLGYLAKSGDGYVKTDKKFEL